MKNLLSLSFLAMFLISIQPVQSYPNPGSIRAKAFQGIQNSWDSSDATKLKTAKLTFYLNDYSDAISVRIKESSGDLQFDAECAEAVISHRPLHVVPPNQHLSGGSRETEITFSAPPRFPGEDIKNYIRSKGLTKNTVVVHIIPPSVLQLFPGLFNREEILSDSNLREVTASKFDVGLPETGFLKDLVSMYAGLGKLYDKNDVTKNDVLQALDIRH